MDDVSKKYNARIENLRRKEYPALLTTTYLDHAGTTLFARSLIDAYHQDLSTNLYGNPHSACPASHLSTQRVDGARRKVLEYFNADPDHFDVIFTANATASIKLVADCFRDQGFWYGFHRDAHNSIVGVRELATEGARCFVSDDEVESWIRNLERDVTSSNLRLFAYPAQSNMTGHRTPLSWSSKIRCACHGGKSTPYILLDAASYLTSGRLDLSDVDAAPDFIALSFYKIFGFPDLGALLVRKSAFEVMTHRRYFGGGTVDQVSVIDRGFHVMRRQSLHDFLEDGTLPFHNIVALEHAIAIHKENFGSAKDISKHTANLAAQLYAYMQSCRHANGEPVVEVHKDENSSYTDPSTQGPILAFSIRRSDRSFVGKTHFEKLAIECGFQIRTGGVCNPGGIATMLNLNHWELRSNFTKGVRCGDDIDVVGGKPTGIIRVSLGPMSIISDIVRFTRFIDFFFVEKTVPRQSSSLKGNRDHQSHQASITPLDGFNHLTLKGVPQTAYQVWDKQWCIVDPAAGRVLPKLAGPDHIRVDIDLEAEQLIISHARSQERLKISLWTVPPEGKEARTVGSRIFDAYEEPHIAKWFEQNLGTPCTLARYRQDDIRKTPVMTTCVVSRCSLYCKTADKLGTHYRIHGEEFLQKHPFGRLNASFKTSGWRDFVKRNTNTALPGLTAKKTLTMTVSPPSSNDTSDTLWLKVASVRLSSSSGMGHALSSKRSNQSLLPNPSG